MRPAPRLLAPFSALIALLAVPALAIGHVELVTSSPKSGANLGAAPDFVRITFDDELDPDLSRFSVTDADGTNVGSGTVDLTVADRNVLRGDVSITRPGVYTVRYTTAGIDGHVQHGTFSFGYQALETIPGPSGGEQGPDTALSAPTAPVVQVSGVLLLVVAGLLLTSRRMVRP